MPLLFVEPLPAVSLIEWSWVWRGRLESGPTKLGMEELQQIRSPDISIRSPVRGGSEPSNKEKLFSAGMSTCGEWRSQWMTESWSSSHALTRTPFCLLCQLRAHRHDHQVWSSMFPAAHAKLMGEHLVETSPAMRALQESKLHGSMRKDILKLVWHDMLDEVPRLSK